MHLTVKRKSEPEPLTGSVTLKVAATAAEIHAMIECELAARPFVRDIDRNRLVLFFELTTAAGVTLRLRPGEQPQDLIDLAEMELRFVEAELAAARRTRCRLSPDLAAGENAHLWQEG